MELSGSHSSVSPVERLDITKSIWLLNNVTRDEAGNILHNKEQGNFLIRDSQMDRSKLALSVKIGFGDGFVVQHFIIIYRSGRVFLEDSDLQFANITSLVFHYSNVCDELPEKLKLPLVLQTIESYQSLVSLALLGKNFWNYPMARSGKNCVMMTSKVSEFDRNNSRQSKVFCDNGVAKVESVTVKNQSILLSDHLNHLNNKTDTSRSEDQNNKIKECDLTKTSITVSTTPPLPPRKISNVSPISGRKQSVSTNLKLSPWRQRRKSDPSSFFSNIAAPAVLPRQTPLDSIRIKDDYFHINPGENLVLDEAQGPFLGSVSNVTTDRSLQSRQRKPSVFNSSLEFITENVELMNSFQNEEEDTAVLNKLIEYTTERVIQEEQKNNHSMHVDSAQEENIRNETIGRKTVNKKTNVNDNMGWSNDSNSSHFNPEEDIYTEPTDNLRNKNNIYSNPLKKPCADLPDVINQCSKQQFLKEEYKTQNSLELRKLRYSDGGLNKIKIVSLDEEIVTRKNSNCKKFSLGPMIRKISNRQLSKSDDVGEQNDSRQERRLSTVMSKLFGNIQDYPLTKHGLKNSNQLNSSSWEYLNKHSEEDIVESKKSVNNKIGREKVEGSDLKTKRILPNSYSSDSVYESEDDYTASTVDSVPSSSVTGESTANDSLLSNRLSSTSNRITLPTNSPLKSKTCLQVEQSIKECIFKLMGRENSNISISIKHFINQTKIHEKEGNPHHIMDNIYKFMIEIRRNIINGKEEELTRTIEVEKSKLESNQFINIDILIEDVFHTFVTKSLTPLIIGLLEKKNVGYKSVKSSISNLARKSLEHFNIPEPKMNELTEVILKCSLSYLQMKDCFSPNEKLDHLVNMASIVNSNISSDIKKGFDLKMFSKVLCWALVQISAKDIEVQLELICGLINPSHLETEAGYFLTPVYSAVLHLKNLGSQQEHEQNHPFILTVSVPDPESNTLQSHCVPIRPNMVVSDIKKTLAEVTTGLSNYQQFGLYYWTEAIGEQRLADCEVLEDVINKCGNNNANFIFRRCDTRIVIPIR